MRSSIALSARPGPDDLHERVEVDAGARAHDQRLADSGGVDRGQGVVDELDHLALPEGADVHDEPAHRLEQRPGAASKSSVAPPAMIVSVPSAAFGAEPVTGASMKRTPRSDSAAPILRVSAGAIVDMSTNSWPGLAPCTAASGPSSRTC